MGLPSGEVDLRDVMAWAQEQTQFLGPPSHALVLWFLCINAFRRDDNPEGRAVGDVLSAYASIARIQRGTGLSDKTVRDALAYLEDQGYIYAEMKHGNGKSKISVFWSEGADERRADARNGIRDLPKGFKRLQKKSVEIPEMEPNLAPVIELHSGKNYRNNR